MTNVTSWDPLQISRTILSNNLYMSLMQATCSPDLITTDWTRDGFPTQVQPNHRLPFELTVCCGVRKRSKPGFPLQQLNKEIDTLSVTVITGVEAEWGHKGHELV